MGESKNLGLLNRALSREEIVPVLEDYGRHMKKFDFDKAREIVDDAKAAFLPAATAIPQTGQQAAWMNLLNSLSLLTLAEKSYTSFSFLLPKGFLRKESSLRSNYNSIRTDLMKIPELVSEKDKSNRESLVDHLVNQFTCYVSGRIDMMNLYEKISTLGSGKGITLPQALAAVEELARKHLKTFHHPLLTPLQSAFATECEILINLFRCQCAIVAFEFIPALLALQDVQSRLQEWYGSAHVTTAQSSWFRFGSSERETQYPVLCQWLKRYYDALLSKFTLYNYGVLSRPAPVPDFKAQLARVPNNYAQKMINFQRKIDAVHMAIVLNALELGASFRGFGYHMAEVESEPLRGLENYPVVFSCPLEKPFGPLLPGVIMLLTSNADKLTLNPDHFEYSCDKQVCHFLCKVELGLYIVLIFGSKKSERDSAIRAFLQELITDLRCTNVFASLKSAAK